MLFCRFLSLFGLTYNLKCFPQNEIEKGKYFVFDVYVYNLINKHS